MLISPSGSMHLSPGHGQGDCNPQHGASDMTQPRQLDCWVGGGHISAIGGIFGSTLTTMQHECEAKMKTKTSAASVALAVQQVHHFGFFVRPVLPLPTPEQVVREKTSPQTFALFHPKIKHFQVHTHTLSERKREAVQLFGQDSSTLFWTSGL